MARRECPFCGKNVSAALTQCVFCRETLPALPRTAKEDDHPVADGSPKVRRGMLFMLLAAVIGYFAGGYSALMLPFPLNPVLTTYLSPMLFLGGLGLCIHGYYLQHKSALQEKSAQHT
jgi:hypothetical protein